MCICLTSLHYSSSMSETLALNFNLNVLSCRLFGRDIGTRVSGYLNPVHTERVEVGVNGALRHPAQPY